MRWSVRTNQNGNSELMHYGILGMKWGVRRTPEQLGHSRRKTNINIGSQHLKYNSPKIASVKNTLIYIGKRFVSSFIPGASLAFYFMDSSKENKMHDDTEYEKGNEKLSELKRKTKRTNNSIKEDTKKVNKIGKKGYLNNCFNCVCALEMRQRGYDVEAMPRGYLKGTSRDYRDYFKNLKIEKSKAPLRQSKESRKKWVLEGYNNLCKNLEQYPEGARGYVSFLYEGTSSGHTISWAIENGRAIFYDSQAGLSGTKATEMLAFSDQSYVYSRFDNLKINPEITQIVKSKKGKK